MSVSESSCQGKTGILTEEFDPGQVVFETLHSGGKDGQNVNKVETEVRAIWGNAVCTEERSQYANKRKALERLLEGFWRKQKELGGGRKTAGGGFVRRLAGAMQFREPDFIPE